MALLPTRLPNLNKDQFKKDTLRVDFNRDLVEWLKYLSKNGGSGGEPGLTPFIGPNGNWWIGTTDTGVMAEGVPGDSAYVYIAYASDDSGTGFSMVPDEDLKFIAILATTVEIENPSASDFAGYWVQYMADDTLQDKYYRHTQNIPSQLWNIQHNLNKYPSVSVTDTSGSFVEGDVTYVDTNNLTLTFNQAFAGNADLN